jgi:hypothetical protein
MRRHTPFLIDDSRCGELDRPGVDLANSLHAARY